MHCTTCGRPADDGYVNEAARERCVDACHDEHLAPEALSAAKSVRAAIAAARTQGSRPHRCPNCSRSYKHRVGLVIHWQLDHRLPLEALS